MKYRRAKQCGLITMLGVLNDKLVRYSDVILTNNGYKTIAHKYQAAESRQRYDAAANHPVGLERETYARNEPYAYDTCNKPSIERCLHFTNIMNK